MQSVSLCLLSGMQFESLSYQKSLRNHLTKHSGDKFNRCNQCDYAFSKGHNLERHMKTQNECNQCDFASYQESLRNNLTIHRGDKFKKCNKCFLRAKRIVQYDYATSRANNLRAHLKTHTGKKNAIKVIMHIFRHLTLHSGEKSKKCNQCDY